MALSDELLRLRLTPGARGDGGGGGMVSVLPGPRVHGLRFPSNLDAPSGTIVAFRLIGANAPPAFPVTYVWRAKFRVQVSNGGNRYRTIFYWADTTETAFVAAGYYGCVPYPDPAPNGTDGKFTISTDGRDISATPTLVVDQWYTQAAVFRLVNTDELESTFYFNLPTTSDVLTDTTISNWATTFPNGAAPGIVFGEAPWVADGERFSGTLGPVKIFDAVLSESDILSEAADMTQIITSAGSTNRWWFKPTFESPNDLTDSVTGVAGAWYNANTARIERVDAPGVALPHRLIRPRPFAAGLAR